MNIVKKTVGEVVIRGRSSGRLRECSVRSANGEHDKSKPFHWLQRKTINVLFRYRQEMDLSNMIDEININVFHPVAGGLLPQTFAGKTERGTEFYFILSRTLLYLFLRVTEC
jgi:hypothetical protein